MRRCQHQCHGNPAAEARGMRRRGKALLFSVVLLASGCALTPSVSPSDVPQPVAWNSLPAATTPLAAPGGRWWGNFQSSELSDLIDRSISDNFSLQAAAARVAQASATATIAGAPQYPTIAISGAVARGHGQGSSLSSLKTQNIFLQASYEIDFWGKNRAIAHSADALATASTFDRDTARVTVTATVANTYFQILSLQERVREAQQLADNARQILRLVETQVSGGIASRLELEQQSNAVATFDADVPVLQQQIDQSMHLLAVLVGVTPEAFTLAGHDLKGITLPAIRAGLPATVLRQRPDIRAAEARLRSANFDAMRPWAAFYPNVALTGQDGLTSGSLANFFLRRR